MASAGLLMRGSMLRVTSMFAYIAIALYMMPFVVHAIGDRWYGMWALIGTLMGYFGYLDFGLSVATQRFMAQAIGRRDDDQVVRLFTTAFVVMLMLAVLAAVATVVIALAAPLFLAHPDEVQVFRVVLLILALNVSITLVMAPVNGLLTAHLRYDIAMYFELIKLAVRTALIIYFIGAGYSIITLAVITLGSDIGGNVMRFLYVRRAHPRVVVQRASFSMQSVRELFDYGGKTFVNQIADVLRFQVDHLVVAYFINLSAVTLYNIAGQLVSYFRMLGGQIMGVLAPLYARYQATDNREALYRTFLLTTKIASFIAVMVGGGIIVLGHAFIGIWMGSNYLGAYEVLLVLVVPAMFYFGQSPSLNLVYGLGAVGTLAKVSLAEALTNLVLSVTLAPRLGLLGVALGTAIPLTFMAGFLAVLGLRLSAVSSGTYLRQVAPVYLLGVLLQAGTFWLVTCFHFHGWLNLVAFALVVYPPQFLIMLWLLFSREEKRFLWHTGRRALGIEPSG